MLSESDALLRLALVPGLSPALVQRLLEACATPAELFVTGAWSACNRSTA